MQNKGVNYFRFSFGSDVGVKGGFSISPGQIWTLDADTCGNDSVSFLGVVGEELVVAEMSFVV
jgi:hypothetical protein